jgi:hypothetical protein
VKNVRDLAEACGKIQPGERFLEGSSLSASWVVVIFSLSWQGDNTTKAPWLSVVWSEHLFVPFLWFSVIPVKAPLTNLLPSRLDWSGTRFQNRICILDALCSQCWCLRACMSAVQQSKQGHSPWRSIVIIQTNKYSPLAPSQACSRESSQDRYVRYRGQQGSGLILHCVLDPL